MPQTNLTIRIDDDLKKEAEALFDKVGLTITSAIIIYFRQAVLEQAIPFQIKAKTDESPALFHKLIDSIRAENKAKGFLTETEIADEIKAYRGEGRASAL